MSNLRNVVVVDGVRTPFAKAGTELAKMSAVHLGVRALQEAVARAGIDYGDLDHVYCGNISQPADAANIARVIALFAGVPKHIPAVTVQRNCASAMEAVAQGFWQIAMGRQEVVAAGGTESMSNIPLLCSEGMKDSFMKLAFSKTISQKLAAVSNFKTKDLKPVVALEQGLTDPVSGMIMGLTAERLSLDFGITREQQDEYALRSHQRALEGKERLADEITPAYVPPKYKKAMEKDNGPREGQSLEALAKLKPYFDRRHGTVTVGNACPVTDGACFMILMSEEKAKAEGYPILGRIRSVAFSGCDPARMGLGPVYSSPMALETAGLTLKEIDIIELNEAFAAQVIACMIGFSSKKFASENLGRSEPIGEVDPEKLNVNGGAIALGHPVGTTGARIILTALKELERRDQQFGLATLCIGGGQGGACVVERAA